MRPSTIILAVLTVVFGVGTVVLLVRFGPGDTGPFLTTLRLGGLVTVGFGAACVIGVVNRRRGERIRDRETAHPGVAFVSARPARSAGRDLAAWSPGVSVRFPCDLAFDPSGVAVWDRRTDERTATIASRREILGFDVFDDTTPLGSTSHWGIAMRLAPRSARPATIHLWIGDEQTQQYEYAMRRTITRIERALGP